MSIFFTTTHVRLLPSACDPADQRTPGSSSTNGFGVLLPFPWIVFSSTLVVIL
jgi:hypothetical protein